MSMIKVIFVDLDKTLLGDDYSPDTGRGIVERLKETGFEVIINSSKCRAEQEYYRKVWGLEEPFITENGSAVFVPEGYFPIELDWAKKGRYNVFELGVRYERIREVLDSIASRYGLKYYGNSSLAEVMAFTGLPRHLAELAMRREYSETIFCWRTPGFEGELEKAGLRAVRGSRFINVVGNTDKGKAARVILGVYSCLGSVESYAVGDGENDFPLFDVVDHAYIVGELEHPKAKNISSLEELLGVIT
jgi:mannosyl-3-phosphoglycerate phosphatase